MHKNIHQGFAVAGWIVVIAASLGFDNEPFKDLLKGFGYGVAIMSSITLYLINRKEKNETTPR